MKQNIKKIYLTEIIIFIFVIIFKFLIMDHFAFYANWVNGIFWFLLLVFLILTGGFIKDKNYLKNSTIRIALIILLIYFFVSYFLGLFTGFNNTIYSKSFIGIMKNIVPLGLIIIFMELCRYLILKKEPNKLQMIIITLLMISLNIIMTINNTTFDSIEKVFMILTAVVLPIAAREFLYTYITHNVSFVPTLILHLVIDLYVYILPIVPDFGNYITAVIGIVLPYMIYKQVSKNISYKEKYNLYGKKYFKKFTLTFILIVMLILTGLVSGFFKYQMVAIASDSMNPVYYRGDAVILIKETAENISEGDILVFKSNNMVITHRVVDISKSGGHYSFTTKGDNNETVDANFVKDDDVIGVVKYIVKYMGFPTVWFNKK